MINKIWNKKIISIPAGFLLIIKIILTRFLNFSFLLIHKYNFKSVGKGTKFSYDLNYRYPQNIKFGKNCIINKKVSFTSEVSASNLEIGNNVTIAVEVKLDFTGNLIIGDNVTLSEKVTIFTHDHKTNPRSTPIMKELVIGENVWIGANSMILQNVKYIGKNSIIAAGSIVTKSVEENTIVGGNPAKFIKMNK